MKPENQFSNHARKAYMKALLVVISSAAGAFLLATSMMGLHHFL